MSKVQEYWSNLFWRCQYWGHDPKMLISWTMMAVMSIWIQVCTKFCLLFILQFLTVFATVAMIVCDINDPSDKPANSTMLWHHSTRRLKMAIPAWHVEVMDTKGNKLRISSLAVKLMKWLHELTQETTKANTVIINLDISIGKCIAAVFTKHVVVPTTAWYERSTETFNKSGFIKLQMRHIKWPGDVYGFVHDWFLAFILRYTTRIAQLLEHHTPKSNGNALEQWLG